MQTQTAARPALERRARILVVDDEPRIRRLVARCLAKAGYWVEVVGSGNEALERALAADFDLVVLDLLMPGTDGMAVLRDLLPRKPDQRVIVLSCLNDTKTKVRALRLGADDYIPKPFSVDELLARVDARLRSPLRAPVAQLRVGRLTLDFEHQVVDTGAGQVPLTRREFLLLLELARHPRVALSKEHLLSALWGFEFDPNSNVVDVFVRRLRSKLGPGVIDTVRGEGYRLGIL